MRRLGKKLSNVTPAQRFFQKGDRVNITAYARRQRLSSIRKSRIGTVIAVSRLVHVVWDGDAAAEIFKYELDFIEKTSPKLTKPVTQFYATI